MKKGFILFFFLLSSSLLAQERGAGIRFGEPISATYKDFFSDYFSWEVLVGRGRPASDRYYKNLFDSNLPTELASYVNHEADPGVVLQARIAYHEDISTALSIPGGYLLAYGGIGAQLRGNRVRYSYFDESRPEDFQVEMKTDLVFGPELFGGGEFYFNEIPIAISLEMGALIQLINQPGHLRYQGGLGVRYLF